MKKTNQSKSKKLRLKRYNKGAYIPINGNDSPDTGILRWTVLASNQDAWIDASVTIWDCSRSITLDFGTSGGRERSAVKTDERAKKIDRMIAGLEAFRRALAEARPIYEAGVEYQKAQPKKKRRISETLDA